MKPNCLSKEKASIKYWPTLTYSHNPAADGFKAMVKVRELSGGYEKRGYCTSEIVQFLKVLPIQLSLEYKAIKSQCTGRVPSVKSFVSRFFNFFIYQYPTSSDMYLFCLVWEKNLWSVLCPCVIFISFSFGHRTCKMSGRSTVTTVSRFIY